MAGVSLDTEGVTVHRRRLRHLPRELPRIALARGIRSRRLIPSDESLESVFSYLSRPLGAHRSTPHRLDHRPGALRPAPLPLLFAAEPLILVGWPGWLGLGQAESSPAGAGGIRRGRFLPLIALIVVSGRARLGDRRRHDRAHPTKPCGAGALEIVLSKLFVCVRRVGGGGRAAMFAAGTITPVAAFRAGLRRGRCRRALAYSALFMALSMLTRLPVLLVLLYITHLEGVLGNFGLGHQSPFGATVLVPLADRLSAATWYRVGVGAGRRPMSVVFPVLGIYFAATGCACSSVAGETSYILRGPRSFGRRRRIAGLA